jgi:hypothetical protein
MSVFVELPNRLSRILGRDDVLEVLLKGMRHGKVFTQPICKCRKSD